MFKQLQNLFQELVMTNLLKFYFISTAGTSPQKVSTQIEGSTPRTTEGVQSLVFKVFVKPL